MVAFAHGGDRGAEIDSRIVTVAELVRRNLPGQRDETVRPAPLDPAQDASGDEQIGKSVV